MSDRRAERVEARRSGVPIPRELMHDHAVWTDPAKVRATFRAYVTREEVELIRDTPAFAGIIRGRVINRWAVANGYRDSRIPGQHADWHRLTAAGLGF